MRAELLEPLRSQPVEPSALGTVAGDAFAGFPGEESEVGDQMPVEAATRVGEPGGAIGMGDKEPPAAEGGDHLGNSDGTLPEGAAVDADPWPQKEGIGELVSEFGDGILEPLLGG